ncbi:long-chain-fatty-acid--CoA ligase [Rhodococcus artemisiae]|uniref:Long-chain-fatty-acid--CoA ligase n=1 Tax=Rhodococcus artemisiae TaxID=714159 RepID=A0ABU7LBL7_9NOCA|nr:long-chain-fatty-acid--CoA ligase [Rhodococcus artemisiae]MEE2058909.1 long-chain-fatty-acid--CoA ligase [Rhodococcus artemisiae]
MIDTVAALLGRLAEVDDRGMRFGDVFVSWGEHVALSHDRAALLRDILDSSRPPHVGVLLDNVPEFSLLLGAAAFSGSVVAGLNTTRRGEALARDILLADCQVVFTETAHIGLLGGLDLPGVRVIDIDSDEWRATTVSYSGSEHIVDATEPDDLFMLIFTSGTSGDPKAVRCTHAKITGPGSMLAERFGLGPADTVYLAMPMFHSNAMMAGWGVALAAESSIALRRRFSASGFLTDLRKFSVTYANYVGKPLSYIVATPELPDDADNPLRIMYGNEGSAPAVAEFARRFDAVVVDGFGSTEGGVSIAATPGAPPGALGRLPDNIVILHPDTGLECPAAEFDADGRLVNADDATGELVNYEGAGAFSGYYKNPQADAERIRDGRYHSGDLAYQDADGFVYFAGRSSGWLRVDGENLGAAPIERTLVRYPGFAQVTVYGVPDRYVGDRVMAAVVPTVDGEFDPIAFAEFLDAQADLGPKQLPTFIRVARSLPRTATFKILTRSLSAERWNCTDPVWVRERHESKFRVLTPELTQSMEPHPAHT